MVLAIVGSFHIQETSAYSKDPYGNGDRPAFVDDTDYIVRITIIFL